MIVACLALVMSLGGTAIASGLISGSSIKKHSISGNRLKNNTLTGTQIRESKLGKVPKAARADKATTATTATNATNAEHATSATSATTATSATNATNASHASSVDGVLIFPTKRVDAAADLASSTKIDLGTRGPFHFYARCYDTGGGTSTRAAEFIEVPDGVNATFGTEGDDSQPSLTSATAETDRELNGETASANSIGDNGTDADFRAASGDTAITGVVGMALAKNGTPATGNGPFGANDSCIFGGVVFG
jgi:hypothetical protein